MPDSNPERAADEPNAPHRPRRTVLGILAAVFFLALLGLFLGGILGIVVGLTFVTLAHISSFEGYSGMLVFFTFGPIGAILGALTFPGVYILRSRNR